MEKITTITAVLNVAFLLLLLGLAIHPFDFADKNVEQLFHSNEGFLYFFGVFMGGILWLGSIVHVIYQRGLKKCQEINNENQKVIIQQNNSIIEDRKEFLKAVQGLSEKITENREDDIDTRMLLNEHQSSIKSLIKSITDFGDWMKESDKRIEAIEKLIKLHHADIDNLKRKK